MPRRPSCHSGGTQFRRWVALETLYAEDYGVYKVRLARSGAGKSGGYRLIVFFRSGERTFYVYGFAKSARDNISNNQLRDFKATAKAALTLPEKQLEEALKTGKYTEI